MNTEPATDAHPVAKRTRRAEPISRRVAKDGAVSYTFRLDTGTGPGGERTRRRYTYRTYAEARQAFRALSADVRRGTYTPPARTTVNEACDLWLAGRRNVRKITLKGYSNDLKPVRRLLGHKRIQDVTKADGDALVSAMLDQGRQDPRHYLPDSLSARIIGLIDQHPDGIASSVIVEAFPGRDVHTVLAGLARAGRITRMRRAVYAPAQSDPAGLAQRGVGPVAVRATLRTFSAVLQSYVDQGVLVRNVIALVERPRVPNTGAIAAWTVEEVAAFIDSVRGERLYACWLLSCYGLRRSEVMGLRWSDVVDDVLSIRRGRVPLGNTSVVDEPKSARSRRDLPMPPDLIEALRILKLRQREEGLALRVKWSDDQLIAVDEAARPIRPEHYSDEFHRLRERAGLRKIRLHGLRVTSTSLMYASGAAPHVVASWHGHDAAISLSVYSHAQPDDLRIAGAKLFGHHL
jgi:integrase